MCISSCLPSSCPCLAVGIVARGPAMFRQPTSRVARRQAMCETIAFPGFIAITAGCKQGAQPWVFAAVSMSQFKEVLHSIVHLPEDLGNALFLKGMRES